MVVSARVFIHPRCLSGPANGAFQAALEARGFDGERFRISPASPRGHRELMRFIGEENGVLTMERMDGVRVVHRQPGASPPPRVA